jgi:Skp family chaperone for outer membrane proteins
MFRAKIKIAAMVFVILFNRGTGSVSAQENKVGDTTPAGGRQTIALVDISYIFDNYPPFKEQMAELKRDVDRAENEVKKKVTGLEETKKKMDASARGSMEYIKLEADLSVSQAELKTGVEAQRKEFLSHEAQLYNDFYVECQREVEAYAKSHGFSMVLRISRDPADRKNPQSVLSYINRPVVYYESSYDITEAIFQRMVEKSKQASSRKEPQSDK